MSVRKKAKAMRNWQKDWELKYFFIEGKHGSSICLICNKTVSELKASKLDRHFTTCHKGYDSKYPLGSDTRNKKFQHLQKSLAQQQSVLQRRPARAEALTTTSAIISWEIARRMKPLNDGEFIKDCMVRAASKLYPNDPSVVQTYKDLQLSSRTVARRIDKLTENVQEQLDHDVSEAQFVSLAFDESTDVTGHAQLCIFIRYVFENSTTKEELLDLVSLQTTTTGQDISDSLLRVLKSHNVPLDRISSIVTDGAPAMVGKNKGAIALLRKSDPSFKFKSFHCLIHQQSLCAKFISAGNVMAAVVKIVNYIRAQPLHRREFRCLLDECESHHEDLLLHTEVRWLSRGRVLQRFSECLPQILSFLSRKKVEFPALTDVPIFKFRLGYLTDITSHLNELNLNLQGKDILICDIIYQINILKRKLLLFSESLRAGDCAHFPSLIDSEENKPFYREETSAFAQNLHDVYDQMEKRFYEFTDLGLNLKLLCNPFDVALHECNNELQLELLQLQCDTMLQDKAPQRDASGNCTASVMRFWQGIHPGRFPIIKREINRLISMLGTTYLCEQAFSAMKTIKTNDRNRLLDANLKSLLVAAKTNFTPQFDTVVTQFQKSH